MIFQQQQKQRPSIPVFASWATMHKPFSTEKHTLGNGGVCYNVQKNTPYANHVESAGFYCSAIISYGADRCGTLRMLRHIVYPTLRLYPNETRSSLDHNFHGVALQVDGKAVRERAVRFVFDGVLHIHTRLNAIEIERNIFAARNSRACVEILHCKNTGSTQSVLSVLDRDPEITTDPKYGADRRSYTLFTQIDRSCIVLEPQETAEICVAYGAENTGEARKTIDCHAELAARRAFLSELSERMRIETPNPTLNAMAYYAKIRASESIFRTKAGLMHSPGGGSYYAALWTNDQCEYVNPLFACLGYETGIEQALNCYKLYQKYISRDEALITSIVAEGDGIWHGAKDRGDSAMYAYGCSRFLLTLGSREIAGQYIDAIRDCLSFTLSQINADGVVKSDSDELENRFESGSANLCTSCLAYDALISTSYLERSLGNAQNADFYLEQAQTLRTAIERYFGKTVEGFETYMYCQEETRLRSWIAMPLAVGIFDRAENTEKALLSPALRKAEGLVTRSGEKTFWDRSTLYALRGLFYAGFTKEAAGLLETYSRARLLGEHIPYAVEAFPEGNQAQLSAESGLYLRIYTEGLLGLRPMGLNSFEIRPHLPENWESFAVRSILLCGKSVDITVTRLEKGYQISLIAEQQTETVCGEFAKFTL